MARSSQERWDSPSDRHLMSGHIYSHVRYSGNWLTWDDRSCSRPRARDNRTSQLSSALVPVSKRLRLRRRRLPVWPVPQEARLGCESASVLGTPGIPPGRIALKTLPLRSAPWRRRPW